MEAEETLTSQTVQVALSRSINQLFRRELFITICDNIQPSTGMLREENLTLLLIVNALIYTVNLRIISLEDSVEKCAL